MKVKDYLPLYGLLYESNSAIFVDGQYVKIFDLFENHEEYELLEFQVRELEMFDRFSLQDHLKHEYFTPQTVTPFLRELFDFYKDSEGVPMYWIGTTFDNILLNPGNYNASIRTEIEKFLLELMDIYSRIGKEIPKAEPLYLEDIFKKETDLDKLVKLLEEKNFITIENGSPKWTGIKSDKARGIGLQLVALSEVCRPLYKPDNYQAKQLNEVWTMYFNYEMKVIKWQPGEVERYITDSYLRLFTFIKDSFRV